MAAKPWVCPDCAESNPDAADFCQYCGCAADDADSPRRGYCRVCDGWQPASAGDRCSRCGGELGLLLPDPHAEPAEQVPAAADPFPHKHGKGAAATGSPRKAAAQTPRSRADHVILEQPASAAENDQTTTERPELGVVSSEAGGRPVTTEADPRGTGMAASRESEAATTSGAGLEAIVLLRELAMLRDEGVITQADFERKKTDILQRI